MVLHTKLDPNFMLKGRMLWGLLLLMVIVSAALIGFVFWDPPRNYDLVTKRNWVIAFVFDLPPIACLVLLSWAFMTLEKSKKSEKSVSKTQAIL